MKTNILTAVLLVAAMGVCSGYAQTVASSASFPLPGRSASDAPYEFRTDKSDGGINVSFTLNNVERVIIDSVTGKSRISVPGLSSTTFAGLPALPYKAFRIAPEGSGTPQIVIRDSTYIDCPINLDHNPEIRYDSIGQPQFIEVARIDYSGFMPSDLARVTDTQIYRDRPIYTITIMPMKYDRATGMLRIFTSLDIDIEYTVQAQTYANAPTRSAAFNAYTDRMLTEALGVDAVSLASDKPTVETRAIIFDPEPVDHPLVSLANATEDLLIISHQSFHAATDSLAEWKEKMGYSVLTIENGNSPWTQERVNNVIRYYYNNLPNLTTVIIMGTDRIVPGYSVKERWPNDYWPTDPLRKDSSTDYPYMCLDSSNDRYPDVAYGRILAYTAQEANDMISKIIAYEKGLFSRSDIYNKAFLATAFWSNPKYPNGRFIPTLEDIFDILSQNEINTQRLYTTDWRIIPTTWDYHWNNQYTPLPSYLQYPQYPWNATAQDVMTAFESGVNLAVYNGHGGNDNWTAFPFTDAHCRQLTTPGSAPLIFSIGCSTANHMDYHNCIVAELSRTTTRGIAVIASSNITYLDYSDPLLIGMIDAIWPNTYTYNGWSDPIEHAAVHRLYDIMERGHSRVELEQGGGYWDRCNLTANYTRLQYQRENFHVYGDPTINYNTERPTPFTGIQCTANERAVYVEVPASNLPAKIVVRRPRDGSIITRKVAPSSTSTMEGFNFSITDSVEVFVSGPNRIPYYEMITDDWSVVGPDSNKAGEIVEANYDSETQTVTVLCALNATAGTPQFYSTDFFGNSNALTAIKQDNNRYVISLDKQKKGLCVISMQINGEIVSIHKLIKK